MRTKCLGTCKWKCRKFQRSRQARCLWRQGRGCAETLPNLGRCEVVHHDFGDMRLKLFAGESSEVRAAMPSVAKAVQDMVNLNVPAGEAQWTLSSVSARAAELEFGLGRQSGDRVLLIQGAGPSGEPAQDLKKKPGAASVTAPRRCFGNYPADEPKGLVAALELDLPKAFRWQNISRIAGNVGLHASETRSRAQIRPFEGSGRSHRVLGR